VNIQVRPATLEDSSLLKSWLMDPEVLRWFPMADEREIDDSVRIWMSYTKLEAGLMAMVDGEPAGLANLYIQPYEKFKHQCLFSIIVASKFRGKGVGTYLLEALKKYAKEKFKIEILHLEVYDGNPAAKLYKRVGFQEYGRHPRFIKIGQTYIDKVFMQQTL
jgi:putative acetyltransferase